MSHYWEEPIDQIDWEAQAIRLLVEAVCDVAHRPLLLRQLENGRLVAPMHVKFFMQSARRKKERGNEHHIDHGRDPRR